MLAEKPIDRLAAVYLLIAERVLISVSFLALRHFKTNCISPAFGYGFLYLSHSFSRGLIGFMVFMLLINSES